MELTKRISDRTENLLNLRVQGEYQSFHIYNAMSNWCDCYGFYKAKDKFREYADEELKHARKLIDYILDRNGIAKTPAITEIQSEYMSLLDVVNKAYQHECSITTSYNTILPIVKEEKDEVTYDFLQWFVHEQVEEEAKFGDLLITAKRLGITDTSVGIELLKFEELL